MLIRNLTVDWKPASFAKETWSGDVLSVQGTLLNKGKTVYSIPKTDVHIGAGSLAKYPISKTFLDLTPSLEVDTILLECFDNEAAHTLIINDGEKEILIKAGKDEEWTKYRFSLSNWWLLVLAGLGILAVITAFSGRGK